MNEKIHIGELILQKLKERERSVAWLAKKVYRDRSNLCKRLKKDDINTKLLSLISSALDFDFSSYYSEDFHNRKLTK